MPKKALGPRSRETGGGAEWRWGAASELGHVFRCCGELQRTQKWAEDTQAPPSMESAPPSTPATVLELAYSHFCSDAHLSREHLPSGFHGQKNLESSLEGERRYHEILVLKFIPQTSVIAHQWLGSVPGAQ